MTALVVAGTGTDVGKTYVAAALLRTARARGLAVEASKPVMSGVHEGRPAASDAGRLLAAMGRRPTREAVAAISPWRFSAAIAPTAAARAEGRALPYEAVLSFCRERISLRADLHLLEGAGGVMSPIAEGALCIDLARDLGLPVVLVAGAYLGAVSHTLTALEALDRRGIATAAVVVSETRQEGVPAEHIVAEATAFTSARLLAWPHGASAPGEELFRLLIG